MQPPWSTSGSTPGATPGGGQPRTSGPITGTSEAVSVRAQTLLRRIMETEHMVGVQEWWMLGNEVPEARALAEVTSLLAVGRGELESILTTYFGATIPASEAELAHPGEDAAALLGDPGWLQARREDAVGLLFTLAQTLPTMRQYAQMLRASAERLGAPSGALDALGIVSDRLGEALEAVSQPGGIGHAE